MNDSIQSEDRAVFRSKVDGFGQHAQHAKLRVVRQRSEAELQGYLAYKKRSDVNDSVQSDLF